MREKNNHNYNYNKESGDRYGLDWLQNVFFFFSCCCQMEWPVFMAKKRSRSGDLFVVRFVI